MGANTHMQGVFGVGYISTGTTLGYAVAGIDPLPGYRVAVQNFGYNTGCGLDYLCFHKVVGYGVTSAICASGATAVTLTGSTLFPAGSVADVDASIAFVTISLTNGTFQHVYIDQYWASTDTAHISTALLASVVAGATVWSYDIHGANAHNICYQFAAASATANVSDYGGAGLFFGNAAGDPMVCTIHGTATSAINYVAGAYINA